MLLRYFLSLLLLVGILSANVELELNKEIYFSEESITIDYTIPHHEVRSNNWIGIYKKGFKSGDDWNDVIYYFWANKLSDTKTTPANLHLKEGDYEARLFYNNSYDEEAVISFHVNNNLISDKEVYLSGETLSFHYSIPDGNEIQDKQNWIGVYKKGKSNDWENVIEWDFIGNSAIGSVAPNYRNKNSSLEEGEYEARLFYNNSYDSEFSIEFSIKSIATEYENYKPADTITIVIPNPNRSQINDTGNTGEKTWIGVFEKNAEIDFDNVIEWDWVIEGQKRVHFGSLPIGNYKVVLFYNNSEIIESKYLFSVTENGEPNGKNISDYGVECDGDIDDSIPLQNALDGYENWENHKLIFPKDGECITRGIKWENVEGVENTPYTLIGNGATLKAKSGANIGEQNQKGWLLWINNASYIQIENLDFDGNRNSRLDTNGDRRDIDFSVSANDENKEIYQLLHNSNLILTSVKNTNLMNVDSDYAIQDGIYIGWRDINFQYPSNIELNNCSASYAFRNNLTVSNCINCTVDEGSYTHAIGVAPESGIDIECDTDKNTTEGQYIINHNNGECLKDISILRTIIKNNVGTGISIPPKFKPKNIQINKNTFMNNRHSERSCDHKGIAITAPGMFGGTILDNIFINTLDKDLYDNGANGIESTCRSLIDFGDSNIDVNLYEGDSVDMSDNKFRDITNIFNNNKKIIYMHSGNIGGHDIKNNIFSNIGLSLNEFNDGDWYKDDNFNYSSTFEYNTLVQ